MGRENYCLTEEIDNLNSVFTVKWDKKIGNKTIITRINHIFC